MNGLTTIKEQMEIMDEVYGNMNPEERYRFLKSLENVEVKSEEELLDSFKYNKSHRESVAATLMRMDNPEWSKMWSRFRREGEVSLLEVCRGDVDLANSMIHESYYNNFLD